MKKLEVISRRELELERVTEKMPERIVCEYRTDCTRNGEFERCYGIGRIYCPFYKTYQVLHNIRKFDGNYDY